MDNKLYFKAGPGESQLVKVGYCLIYPRVKTRGIHYFFDCYENWSPGWKKNFNGWKLVKTTDLDETYSPCGKCIKRIKEQGLIDYGLKQGLDPRGIMGYQEGVNFIFDQKYKDDTTVLFALENKKVKITAYKEHVICDIDGQVVRLSYDDVVTFRLNNNRLDMEFRARGLGQSLKPAGVYYDLTDVEMKKYGGEILKLSQKLDEISMKKYGHLREAPFYSLAKSLQEIVQLAEEAQSNEEALEHKDAWKDEEAAKKIEDILESMEKEKPGR